MSAQRELPEQDCAGWHQLACALLERAVSEERKGNVLVIGHGGLPLPSCVSLVRDERSFGVALHLQAGASQQSGMARSSPDTGVEFKVDCASHALPFQEGSFRSIILYQVTRDGREPEVAEACRVLHPDGELLIVGINQKSWSGMKNRQHTAVPVLRLSALRESLQHRGMQIDSVWGAGLLGQARPLMERQRISRLLIPFADLLLVKVRHCQRPMMTRLRLKEFPASALPTALVTVCPL